MKRIVLFSLALLGLLGAVNATSPPAAVEPPSAAVKPPAVELSVEVENLDQEAALLAEGGVTSTPTTCQVCITSTGCSGGAGTVCNSASNCTCKWCAGQLDCRPNPPCNPPGPCPIGPPQLADDPPPQP